MSIEVFKELQTLVGDWSGETPSGQILKVAYRLVANETALVETWELAPGRESLTVYHMDGSELISTHYCPLGNQPRLRLQPSIEKNKYLFEFLDATNLGNADSAHQHRFELRLIDKNRFERSETYLEKGIEESEAISYLRRC